MTGSCSAAATPARTGSRCAAPGCAGSTTRRWAMLLSFAAYRQSLDTSWVVGTVVDADIHRYPGGSLRCLASRRDETHPTAPPVVGVSIAEACDEVGSIVAAEPWLEHVPVTVTAAPTTDGRRWLLTDDTGSLPIARRQRADRGRARRVARCGRSRSRWNGRRTASCR